MASSSSNVVGVHYRVGKKIGEGSFGVIFEGTNLLNNQQVAIKFVRRENCSPSVTSLMLDRNLGKAMLPNYGMSIERTRYWSAAVSHSTSHERSAPNQTQPVFPMFTTLAKKASITFSSLTSLARAWRTCSTTATDDFR